MTRGGNYLGNHVEPFLPFIIFEITKYSENNTLFCALWSSPDGSVKHSFLHQNKPRMDGNLRSFARPRRALKLPLLNWLMANLSKKICLLSKMYDGFWKTWSSMVCCFNFTCWNLFLFPDFLSSWSAWARRWSSPPLSSTSSGGNGQPDHLCHDAVLFRQQETYKIYAIRNSK